MARKTSSDGEMGSDSQSCHILLKCPVFNKFIRHEKEKKKNTGKYGPHNGEKAGNTDSVRGSLDIRLTG